MSSSPLTDNAQQGATLNQLSRLLFDDAALRWQLSLAIQFVAGLVGLAVSIAAPPLEASTVWALVVMALLALSYWVRFSYEKRHDVAETMRRQSVLSEGLGWAIGRSQFNEWKSRAGRRILESALQNPRPANYYQTNEGGGPKRLAEMTFESLFWTKNLYRKMRLYIAAFFAVIAIILVGMLSASPLMTDDSKARFYLAYAVYLFVPVLISMDVIGLLLKLNRAIGALSSIEPHIERFAIAPEPPVAEVLRLVAEYNCTVASGVPIPGWIWKLHQSEIQRYWDA